MPKCPHCKQSFHIREDEYPECCPYCGWKPNYGLREEADRLVEGLPNKEGGEPDA